MINQGTSQNIYKFLYYNKEKPLRKAKGNSPEKLAKNSPL